MFDQNTYFRESITSKSAKPALAKSPNKLNKIVFTADPLNGEVIEAIERKEIGPHIDKESMVKSLVSFGWKTDDAENIWAFAPGEDGANILVNKTKQIQFLEEVKEYLVWGFRWSSSEGPLCGEPYYGIKFSIIDCQISENLVHRGLGQIMALSRRACFASILSAQPCLLQSTNQKTWEKVEGDPLKKDGGIARRFVEEIRQRKGMFTRRPPYQNEYTDEE